jgi:hypothetical protein
MRARSGGATSVGVVNVQDCWTGNTMNAVVAVNGGTGGQGARSADESEG